SESTVIVTEMVTGDEELPEGVRGVLTTSHVDLVSHLAVRARNAGVLLAVCFDPAKPEELKKGGGKTLAIRGTPGGDVEDQECDARQDEKRQPSPPRAHVSSRPRSAISQWAVGDDAFTPEIVGGKSNNLNALRNRVPESIHLPRSVALPFGVLERTLECEP